MNNLKYIRLTSLLRKVSGVLIIFLYLINSKQCFAQADNYSSDSLLSKIKGEKYQYAHQTTIKGWVYVVKNNKVGLFNIGSEKNILECNYNWIRLTTIANKFGFMTENQFFSVDTITSDGTNNEHTFKLGEKYPINNNRLEDEVLMDPAKRIFRVMYRSTKQSFKNQKSSISIETKNNSNAIYMAINYNSFKPAVVEEYYPEINIYGEPILEPITGLPYLIEYDTIKKSTGEITTFVYDLKLNKPIIEKGVYQSLERIKVSDCLNTTTKLYFVGKKDNHSNPVILNSDFTLFDISLKEKYTTHEEKLKIKKVNIIYPNYFLFHTNDYSTPYYHYYIGNNTTTEGGLLLYDYYSGIPELGMVIFNIEDKKGIYFNYTNKMFSGLAFDSCSILYDNITIEGESNSRWVEPTTKVLLIKDGKEIETTIDEIYNYAK